MVGGEGQEHSRGVEAAGCHPPLQATMQLPHNRLYSKSIKVLDENIGRTFFDINHSNVPFDPSPRVMEINKWDVIKLKSFCTAKETINKTKTQPTGWEKVFANDPTNGINLQNLQTAHAAQYQNENKQPNQKMGRRPK